MIDHVTLPVFNLARRRAFYREALAPLERRLVATDGQPIGLGPETREFGVLAASAPIAGIHVAFQARSRSAVDTFFTAAPAAGGMTNGPAGVRPRQDSRRYAACVLDPDGHNVEAVFRGWRAVQPPAGVAVTVKATRRSPYRAAAQPHCPMSDPKIGVG